MAFKRSKPAPSPQTATGSGWNSLAASNRDNSEILAAVQQRHLIIRFGIDADRARLVASLAFGEVLR